MCVLIDTPVIIQTPPPQILGKPKISTGKKIDAIMDKVRLGLFFRDAEATKENLEKAKKLIEDVSMYVWAVGLGDGGLPASPSLSQSVRQASCHHHLYLFTRSIRITANAPPRHAQGGDWDRRNRLKVYEALALIGQRNVKKAAELLLDCIATFTCTELASYNQFIFYAVVTNILHLERTQMKKKLVDGARAPPGSVPSVPWQAAASLASMHTDRPLVHTQTTGPEVVAVLREAPVLGKLLTSLYDCDYKGFFQALVDITPDLTRDR